MKLSKRVMVTFLACVMLFLCTACGLNAPQDKVITEGSMQITLTDEFEKQDYSSQGYDWAYASKKAVIMCVTESGSELADAGLTITSAAGYGEICVQANTYASGAQVTVGVDYPYCEYNATVQGQNYSYYAVFYQNGDDFSVITFCCLADDYGDMKANFEKWASSVTFQ